MADERHKRIQEKMNDDLEWQSIQLAGEILEKNSDMLAYCRIVNKKARTKKEIKANSDTGDIFLIKKDHSEIKIVEVKRLSEENYGGDFISAGTFPFKNFIVDGVTQYNKKNPKPYLYMCFNSTLTAVALFYCKNIDKCSIDERSGNESKKKYYIAPKDLVKFRIVEELLNG